jgi:hypothetical protein
MEIATVAALAAAVVALVAVGVLARAIRVERRRHSDQLDTVLLELEELRRTRETEVEHLVAHRAEGGPARAEFLITDVGEPRPEQTVADRLVLSATLGEPLVKAVAFGHGLRRALSPRARNRILFEMRREVRRTRKQRRREMKQAWRRSRSEEPAG